MKKRFKAFAALLLAMVFVLCFAFTACETNTPGGNEGENPGGNQGENPGGNQGENPGGNQGENPGGEVETPEKVVYTVTVECAEPAGLEGVKVELKKGDASMGELALSGGKATFELDEGTYTAVLKNLPADYICTSTNFTLTKAAPSITLTVEKKPAAPVLTVSDVPTTGVIGEEVTLPAATATSYKNTDLTYAVKVTVEGIGEDGSRDNSFLHDAAANVETHFTPETYTQYKIIYSVTDDAESKMSTTREFDFTAEPAPAPDPEVAVTATDTYYANAATANDLSGLTAKAGQSGYLSEYNAGGTHTNGKALHGAAIAAGSKFSIVISASAATTVFVRVYLAADAAFNEKLGQGANALAGVLKFEMDGTEITDVKVTEQFDGTGSYENFKAVEVGADCFGTLGAHDLDEGSHVFTITFVGDDCPDLDQISVTAATYEGYVTSPTVEHPYKNGYTDEELVAMYNVEGDNIITYLCDDYRSSGSIYAISANVYNELQTVGEADAKGWLHVDRTHAYFELAGTSYPMDYYDTAAVVFRNWYPAIKQIGNAYFLWLVNFNAFADSDGGWTDSVLTAFIWDKKDGSGQNRCATGAGLTYYIEKRDKIVESSDDGTTKTYTVTEGMFGSFSYLSHKGTEIDGVTWYELDPEQVGIQSVWEKLPAEGMTEYVKVSEMQGVKFYAAKSDGAYYLRIENYAAVTITPTGPNNKARCVLVWTSNEGELCMQTFLAPHQ